MLPPVGLAKKQETQVADLKVSELEVWVWLRQVLSGA